MRQMEDLIHNHQSIQDKYEGLHQAANKKTDLLEDMVREQTGLRSSEVCHFIYLFTLSYIRRFKKSGWCS